MPTRERPLSPHLQVYSWQITMVMSILHRATGVALAVGIFGLAWWLLALAQGGEAFAHAARCVASSLTRRHPCGRAHAPRCLGSSVQVLRRRSGAIA